MKKVFHFIKRKKNDLSQKKRYRIQTQQISRDKNKEVFFLIGTPEHGNLGDHAIARAELQFLRDSFPDKDIIEITGDHFRYDSEGIKNLVVQKDKIFIHGGGFLGTLWVHEQDMALDAINLFPNNKVIIFPQTIFVSNDNDGEKELRKLKDTFRGHSNLYLCTRELNSYNMALKKNLVRKEKNCLLVPDIVPYLVEHELSSERNGVLLCLRKDKEKVLTEQEEKRLKQYALKYTEIVAYTDTVINRGIPIVKRDEELNKKFFEFRRAQLIITDRLHGMIFAAITGTPCIALDNSSRKVSGVYEWIKHLDYIVYTDNINDIPHYMDQLISKKNHFYDNSTLKPYYQKIKAVIE